MAKEYARPLLDVKAKPKVTNAADWLYTSGAGVPGVAAFRFRRTQAFAELFDVVG